MDFEEKQRLARTHDMGAAASAIRLRAARLFTGLQAKEIAAEAKISKQVLSNAEAGLAFPNRQILQYYYRTHRIDFNFLMNGDFVQLAGDVQDRLFVALQTANIEWDRREDSDPNQRVQQQIQQQT